MKVGDFIGRAIWYAFLIAFVVLVFAVCRSECQIVEYRFVTPGLGGMVSNYDIGTLRETESPYLFNCDVTSRRGRVRPRTAMQNYGVNTTKLYGAFGYYNPLTGDKLVLGVTDHETYNLGQFVVSDTFGTEAGYDTLDGTMFPYADAYHDFTPYKDMVICADGKSIPSIFTTSQGFLYTLSKPDTFGFDPHLTSMGLEAPGQPRIGIVNYSDTGELNGRYIYAFAYSSDSVIGIESRPLTVGNDDIYITNFPLDTSLFLLRKTGQEDNLWYSVVETTITTEGYYYIDSITDTSQTIYVSWWKNDVNYFDTLPTSDLGYYWTHWSGSDNYQCCNEPESWDSLGYRRLHWSNDRGRCCGGGDLESCEIDYGCGSIWLGDNDSITTDVDSFTVDTIGAQVFVPQSSGRAPGQFVYIGQGGKIDTVGYVDSLAMAHPESLYWIAYSYYDQVTGIESPLGPMLACSLTEIDTDSVFSRLFAFDNFDTTLNPSNIRVYQTVTKTTLPGASDTMVWYGILEMRAFDGTVVLGNWNDDSVAVGLDTSYITTQQYYTHQMLRESGVVKILPLYNYDCRIPFSDIEYMAGQFWGIGDPDYPNRIYYSGYDWPGMNIFSWYPLDFVQIQEIGNDELVKIERAEGFGVDALYIFAHNSIWLLNTSGDYQAISTRIGVASQETVVKYGEDVYFLSPNLRIYVITGGQLQEISQPVENFVDSVFVDWPVYGYQGFYVWGHTLGDYVRWFNDTTGMGLSFNTKSGTWSLERYGSGAYVPRGSFVYDTMRSGGISVMMTSDVELLYMDSVVKFKKHVVGQTGTDQGSIISEKAIEFHYQTPYMGDGLREWQVQEIALSIQPNTYDGIIRYEVYNEYGDSLCSDTFVYSFSSDILHYRLHAPYNIGHRLSVRIFSNDTVKTGAILQIHSYEIVDLTVKVRDMGVDNVR